MKKLLLLSALLMHPIASLGTPPICADGLEVNTICRVSIRDLRPTQMSVGMIEVRANQRKLEKLSRESINDLLRRKPEPIVVGPEGALFIIDHHHLARTLHEIGVEFTYGQIVADDSELSLANFWRKMEKRSWVYPFDENGRGPHPYNELPLSVQELKDDPYRSLAGIVRREGGFGKTSAPFAEFLWADFFRIRIRIEESESSFAQAVTDAMKLARSKEARNLPGYMGDL